MVRAAHPTLGAAPGHPASWRDERGRFHSGVGCAVRTIRSDSSGDSSDQPPAAASSRGSSQGGEPSRTMRQEPSGCRRQTDVKLPVHLPSVS